MGRCRTSGLASLTSVVVALSSCKNEALTKGEAVPLADEMWSSARFPSSHTGHALAFEHRTGIYYYFASTDIPVEPNRNYPKTGTYLQDEASGELVLDTIFAGSVRLIEVNLEGTRALVPKGFEDDIDAALDDGFVLLERSYVDLQNPWATTEDTEFEKKNQARK